MFHNILCSCSFGILLIFVYMFMLAYIGPNKQVIMNINMYGEADIEMLVIIPLVCLSEFFISYRVLREMA